MKKRIPVSPKIGAWIFIFGGALMFSVGLFLVLAPQNRSDSCTVKVTATVTDNILHEYTGEVKRRVFIPVFEFDFEGRHYTVSPQSGTNQQDYPTGSEITLHIDPTDPTKFYAQPSPNNLKLGRFFMVLSIIVILIDIPVALKRDDSAIVG